MLSLLKRASFAAVAALAAALPHALLAQAPRPALTIEGPKVSDFAPNRFPTARPGSGLPAT